MCTVTWLHKAGGYHLLCNRDEKRARAVAEPPRIVELGGARYIAPTDASVGGTWIAVNDYGLALCLLNGGPRAGERSRGFVIPALIPAQSVDDCTFLFRRLDLASFAPFALLMLERGRPAAVARWDGTCSVIDPDARGPLTSSSFATEEVRRERCAEYARRNPGDPGALYRFHASHAGPTGAHAPCMHRADARTVSFSWITVTENEISFRYRPGSPCAMAA